MIQLGPAALTGLALAPLALGCLRGGRNPPAPSSTSTSLARDPHSFSRPWEVAVRHLDLDLTVDFDARQIRGEVTLTVDRRGATDHRLILDTRDLAVSEVILDDGTPAPFALGPEHPHLGRPLEIAIAPPTRLVRVRYATSSKAAALQWLEGRQTASGKPFLFSQSQAILARSWIPIQDTPGVRATYAARVRVPPGLLALMSAENPQRPSTDGDYRFRMPQPVPSYLMALAVGDLELRPMSARTGVYAEPPTAAAAAWELADTERMLAAAESLYGPYRWGRYDLLLLPPSFPFGGMENPRLTFATPTLLAGDRSLAALVAHELAHSWSGNLVTNATWNDLWLNEGFTTYFERRIMEELHGHDHAQMLWALGLRDLRDTVADLGAANPGTALHLDLAGRDPDEGMNDIAYEKGALFLRRIEETVGRRRWDAFLEKYFDTFAFRSMDTAGFLSYLEENLLSEREIDEVEVDAWVYRPGLPANLPPVVSDAFIHVEEQIEAWAAGTAAAHLPDGGWNTQQWLHFLRNLPRPLSAERMEELDRAFSLTESGNAEILAVWLELAIGNDYRAAYPALERFLLGMGRRKFLKPLYTDLAKTPEGKALALRIYAEARSGYHEIARATIDEILGWPA